jgi:tetratricopeptide (TPR) repeat protein
VLSQFSEDAAPSLEQARALARKLGARSVIHGTLVRTGAKVRVDLALFDGDDARPTVQASATSAPEDVAALTDSATWALLAEVWRSGEPPSPSISTATTRSIPALRAFLEGERYIAQGRFYQAPGAFQRAIEADSTFWIAYWRLAFTLGWHGQPIDSTVRAAYRNHRDQLPAPDRALIEVNLSGDSLSGRVAQMRAITQRFPSYWPALLMYQDILVHTSPFVGTSLDDSRAVLERLTQLNPELVPAWTHLMWIVTLQKDSAASRRILGELTRLQLDSITVADQGLDELGFYRITDQFLRDDFVPDTSAVMQGIRMLADSRGPFPLDAVAGSIMRAGFAAKEVDFDRLFLGVAGDAPLGLKGAMYRALSSSFAARGAWDSAVAYAGKYADLTPSPPSSLFGYRLAAVGEWLGATDSINTDGWRKRLESTPLTLPFAQMHLLWLEGLVAATRRDSTTLDAKRSQLRAAPPGDAVNLERSLAALASDLHGDTVGAGRQLAELELGIAERTQSRGFSNRQPLVSAVNRLTAAKRLRQAGDYATAERLLHFFEAVLTTNEVDSESATRSMTAPIWYERARIAEARGQKDTALRAYQHVLEEYDMPVRGLRWMTEEAGQAIDRAERPPRGGQ